MANLIIAPSAEEDLNRIVDYITRDICNPEAADSLLDSIAECYDTLELMPSSFPFCGDPILRADDYHQVDLGGYVMMYPKNGNFLREPQRYNENVLFFVS